MIRRDAYLNIWNSLSRNKNMIFIAGPRQSGKTTLAFDISKSFSNNLYFNWDNMEDKGRIIKKPYFFSELVRNDDSMPLVIFDEIHKYNEWKNYLKGVYDGFHDKYKFLVSGSGRLDIYHKGGDSLAGRYELFHLFPFTLNELSKTENSLSDFINNPFLLNNGSGKISFGILEDLMKYSGFPEPFESKDIEVWRRWTNNYSRQLIREDIRDLSGLRTVELFETLFSLLPGKVGSPLSMNSLAEDLKVSHTTVKSWIDTLERFFMVFQIPPWTNKINRAIHKEKKLYLYNTPLVKEDGAKLENAVALELYRAVTNWNEAGKGFFSLHYIRNKEKQEVDFLIAESNNPKVLIEVKKSSQAPSESLKKIQKILNVPAVQLNGSSEVSHVLYENNGCQIMSVAAHRWISSLP